jgi:hypothetical protein
MSALMMSTASEEVEAMQALASYDKGVLLQKAEAPLKIKTKAELEAIRAAHDVTRSALAPERMNELQQQVKSLLVALEAACRGETWTKYNQETGTEGSTRMLASESVEQQLDESTIRDVIEMMPHAVSGCIARKVRARLTEALLSGETLEEEEEDEQEDVLGLGPISELSIQELELMAELSSRELLSSSSVAGALFTSSPHHGSSFSGQDSAASLGSLMDAEEELKKAAMLSRRKSTEKLLHDSRLADYNKCMAILTRPQGMKVKKHNHSGGTSVRSIHFHPSRKCLMWQSSRLVGAERIQAWRIVKVLREEVIVYIWHMGKGVHGAEKKMVGFELQRESDAIILENFLLHLKETHKSADA